MEKLEFILKLLKKIIITILYVSLAFFILKYVKQMIHKFFDEMKLSINSTFEKKKQTIEDLIYHILQIVILSFAFMYILSAWGISIGPILAGAGIVGISFGMGAQTVLKDIISGFMIMILGTINVGDHVNIQGKTGIVQNISLYSTILTGDNGTRIIIPNSEISIVTILN